jgi:hypothetical protein
MTKKGDTWNESTAYRDLFSLRTVRKVTAGGSYNYHPAYHTLTAWSADGKRCIFKSGRKNHSTIFVCDVATGDMTQLLDWQEGWGVDASWAPDDRPFGIGGICLDAHSGWVYYVQHNTGTTALKAVHIDSLQERTLSEGIAGYAFGQPTVSGDSQWVALPSNIIPAQMRNVDSYKPLSIGQVHEIFASEGGSRMQLVRFPTHGDPVPEVVYDEADCRGNHLQYSPVDANILHTDRDFAPRFWAGSDQVRNRVWLWHIDTQRLVEQPSLSGRTFQVHSVWTFDGQEVLYHCPPSRTDPGGYVIGVNDLEGNNVAEYHSSAWTHYGHVGAVAGHKAIMIDGNITDDLILWLYYDDPSTPRIEVICRHGTNWGGHEWQYPHPHPQCAPTGDRILYNAASRGRSDVFIVEV